MVRRGMSVVDRERQPRRGCTTNVLRNQHPSLYLRCRLLPRRSISPLRAIRPTECASVCACVRACVRVLAACGYCRETLNNTPTTPLLTAAGGMYVCMDGWMDGWMGGWVAAFVRWNHQGRHEKCHRHDYLYVLCDQPRCHTTLCSVAVLRCSLSLHDETCVRACVREFCANARVHAGTASSWVASARFCYATCARSRGCSTR